MILFGPAAAPRWFDQDHIRFERYLDVIAGAGARAIEFVVLPEGGTEELGRVHLLGPRAASTILTAHSRGFVVNLHAPLPAEYQLSGWARNRKEFQQRFAPVLRFLSEAEAGQSIPPVLVLHCAGNDQGATADAIAWMDDTLSESQSPARLSLEVRAPVDHDDRCFDRQVDTLADFVRKIASDRIGICWDIAHDWERTGQITCLAPELLATINHVHLHDSRDGQRVHAPLDTGAIPWRNAIRQLIAADWSGSITLEIRYRYAVEKGEPWDVLSASLRAARSVLAGE